MNVKLRLIQTSPTAPSRTIRCVACATILLLAGCAHSSRVPSTTFVTATRENQTAERYVIDAPDELLFKAIDIKEMNDVVREVATDGNVSLPLVGVLRVDGLTPKRVEQIVDEKLAKYYVHPDIKLEVIAKSKFWYVFGAQVSKLPYTGGDTILEVLNAVTPAVDVAKTPTVVLDRPARDGHPAERAVVDCRRLLEGSDLSQNYLINVGDIVVVGPTSAVDIASYRRRVNERDQRILVSWNTSNGVTSRAELTLKDE